MSRSIVGDAGRPVISEVQPEAAITGGELYIRGKSLATHDRPHVTIGDVSAMMAGLSHADPMLMDPSQRRRCVALVCDSLLVGARSVLPQCELSRSSQGAVRRGSRSS